MSLQLRPANDRDAALILEFIRKLAEYERLLDKVAATEEDLRRWLFGPQRVAECVIAEWNGKAVGFAVFFANFSTFQGRPGLYLEDLFVDPEVRGKGIGKALLVHLAGLAVERGYSRMEWSVLDWNDPAIGFYKSLGAAPMDEWTTFRLTGEALSALAAAG